MSDFSVLIAANSERWKRAKITRNDFRKVAARLCSNKSRYQIIEKSTTVPWQNIAVIHEREASGNFSANIAQGDPWDKVSTHVPAGRGPFNSFENAAYDALRNCPPKAAEWQDWTAGGSLTLLERYNGMAYANHNRPSPYIWSGTDVYDPPTGPGGKVLVDHGTIENVTDKQLGCAGLLMAMQQIDPSIRFSDDAPKPSIKPDAKTAGPIATGTAAGGAAHATGLSPIICIAIGLAIAVIAFVIIKNRKQQ